jgi:hypothetical protein
MAFAVEEDASFRPNARKPARFAGYSGSGAAAGLIEQLGSARDGIGRRDVGAHGQKKPEQGRPA